jgi:hypothetical protein
MQLRRETTMNAQELLVHNSGQGKVAERIHACVINPFRVFVLAFELEGEVIRQVPALVIPSE